MFLFGSRLLHFWVDDSRFLGIGLLVAWQLRDKQYKCVKFLLIFCLFDMQDRISASSVCKSWRHCLFYSRFWTELKLKSIKGSTAEGSLFLAERVPLRCIRKLALTFDTEDQCVMQVNNWLVLFTRAERLSEIVLRPRQCITSCIISAQYASHQSNKMNHSLFSPFSSIERLCIGNQLCLSVWLVIWRRSWPRIVASVSWTLATAVDCWPTLSCGRPFPVG